MGKLVDKPPRAKPKHLAFLPAMANPRASMTSLGMRSCAMSSLHFDADYGELAPFVAPHITLARRFCCQVNIMLRAKHAFGWTLLHFAARRSTREIELFDVVLKTIKESLSEEQVLQQSVFLPRCSGFLNHYLNSLVGGP